MEKFIPYEYYPISGSMLNKLYAIQVKLYLGKKVTADEMRDIAHIFGLIFDEAASIGKISTE